MKYKIFHPVGGYMNYNYEPMLYMYELVYTVTADSHEDAFRLSQNDFNEEYASMGIRSTSVGDIIQSEEDAELLQCALVMPVGMDIVPSSWLRYIDHSYSPVEPSNYEYGE